MCDEPFRFHDVGQFSLLEKKIKKKKLSPYFCILQHYFVEFTNQKKKNLAATIH